MRGRVSKVLCVVGAGFQNIYNKLTYLKRMVRALVGGSRHSFFAICRQNSQQRELVIQFLIQKSSDNKKQVDGTNSRQWKPFEMMGNWLTPEEGAYFAESSEIINSNNPKWPIFSWFLITWKSRLLATLKGYHKATESIACSKVSFIQKDSLEGKKWSL